MPENLDVSSYYSRTLIIQNLRKTYPKYSFILTLFLFINFHLVFARNIPPPKKKVCQLYPLLHSFRLCKENLYISLFFLTSAVDLLMYDGLFFYIVSFPWIRRNDYSPYLNFVLPIVPSPSSTNRSSARLWNVLFDNFLYLTLPLYVMIIFLTDYTLLITLADSYDDQIHWMSKSHM